MGVSVPLKLKDSAGLQSFDSDDYDFLAYRAGLLLRQSDSSDKAGFTRYNPAYQNTISVGSFTNTEFDSDVGIGGDTALLSTTSTISSIFRNVGTDSVGTLETYDDSNYVNLFYQTDSALDSGSQLQLKAFVDSDWNVLTDEILSRVYKYDYAGSIRLASNVTDFDSANGGWSTILSNVFTDTRTSDSAGNRDSDDVVYNLFQKVDMTGIGVPSDSSRPFTFKRRIDSAEINIAGAFKDIGRDSDLPHSKGKYYPSSTGVLSFTGLNRVSMSWADLNDDDYFDSSSQLVLSLDKEWSDKIYGVWQRANGPAGRGPKDFLLKNFQKTQFSTVGKVYPSDAGKYENKQHHNPSTYFVYKDSAGDTLPNRLGSRPQVWLGVKGRVNLIDSDRFGSVAATFAATDATMQKHVESDGKWSFHFNFDSDATFRNRRIGDHTSSAPNGLTSGITYIYDSEGVMDFAPNSNDDEYADVAVSRPGYNFWQFPSPSATNKAAIIPDSSSGELIRHMEFNNYFGELTTANPMTSGFKGIGYDSADEINLILKNDFQGLQLADSDNLDETLGTRVRNRLTSTDTIGAATVLSAAEGTPLQNGFTGTWISKGTATDTRKALVDTNYTRTRVSTYARLRTSSYATEFSDTYQIIRTSQYSDGYIGNYSRDFTRGRESNFTRNSTRTRLNSITIVSTRTSTGNYIGGGKADVNYIGNYTGDFFRTFAGNYLGDYTGDFTGNFEGNYSRDFLRTRPAFFSRDFEGNYTGNYSRNFQGNYTGNFTGNYLGPLLRTTPTTRTQHGVNLAQYESFSPGNGNFSGWDLVAAFTNVPDGQFITTGTVRGNAYQDRGSGTWSGTLYLRARMPNGTVLQEKTVAVNNVTQSFLRAPGALKTIGAFGFTNPSGNNTIIWEAGCQTNHGHSSCIEVFNMTAADGFEYTRTSTRTSLRSRASTFSADYARTRTSTYQAGENFSRDFQGDYTGNYIGNFTREFIGNYSRNFIGDFTGDAIGTGSETIETYTLYVKVG